MKPYLETRQLSVPVHESNFLFSLRIRMLDIRAYYREKHRYTTCPCCWAHDDSQENLLGCRMLEQDGDMVCNTLDYQDLFKESVSKQTEITRRLKKKFSLRKKITTYFLFI